MQTLLETQKGHFRSVIGTCIFHHEKCGLGPAHFNERFFEDTIKRLVVGDTAPEDLLEIIDVIKIDDHVGTFVECNHVVHGSEAVGDKREKYVAPDFH